jgi:hypothetical protein
MIETGDPAIPQTDRSLADFTGIHRSSEGQKGSICASSGRKQNADALRQVVVSFPNQALVSRQKQERCREQNQERKQDPVNIHCDSQLGKAGRADQLAFVPSERSIQNGPGTEFNSQ